ncbi:MAG: hypothetical protein M3R43_07245 [Acidobacteriota bacterium]|nr:hypothetical protein [Acidobacteriota bacterium]
MRLRLDVCVLSLGLVAGGVSAQQPRGAQEALGNMASQPATHTAFTFDKDMLQMVGGDGPYQRAVAALNSITFEAYKFHEPAFYIPETMASLVAAYDRAGWKHLVNQNATSPRDATMPRKAMTDLWLHFRGAEIDDVTVLVRGPKQMDLIEVSGLLRPLDLVHLSGHFGIPKVDPDAVMVPAPPGR